MARRYAPRRGDLVWLDLAPQAGHEQSGRRPALVLSPEAYNRRVGLAVCCPVTSTPKGYPFEVALPEGLGVHGAILSDHLKSLDWRVRKARRIDAVSTETLEAVVARVSALLLEDA